MKVCHFTSVHHRYDTRIFIKQSRSLAKSDFDVKLIVADGKGDQVCQEVSIIDVGKSSENRFIRFFKTGWKVYRAAKKQCAHIYHFHDPELIFFALLLRLSGMKVIYDVHEDLPRQIVSNKPYIPKSIRKILAWIAETIENVFATKMNAIITVTPYIADRFRFRCKNVEVLYNFPIIDLESSFPNWNDKNKEVCYVGSLSKARGVVELVESLQFNNFKLNLGGSFNDKGLEKKVTSMVSWSNVNYHGYVNRDQLDAILEKSMVGIVTLYHTDSYRFAIPVKLFEYMRAGIPVVISDIPLWKRMVEQANCGVVVNPKDSAAISEAVQELINNPEKAEELGRNGWEVVRERYNWANEEEKLLNLYQKLK
tara:strand:- start:6661 stop:7761 length:1101 start_codon:yes stop_codon:yes gene_type:complete